MSRWKPICVDISTPGEEAPRIELLRTTTQPIPTFRSCPGVPTTYERDRGTRHRPFTGTNLCMFRQKWRTHWSLIWDLSNYCRRRQPEICYANSPKWQWIRTTRQRKAVDTNIEIVFGGYYIRPAMDRYSRKGNSRVQLFFQCEQVSTEGKGSRKHLLAGTNSLLSEITVKVLPAHFPVSANRVFFFNFTP